MQSPTRSRSAPQPTAVVVAGGRALVVSTNLDAELCADRQRHRHGRSIRRTMQVLGTAQMGGTNSTDAAVGPDGLLYVVNTGDFVAQGSLTIVNPATMQVQATIPNIGVGSGRDHHRRERVGVHLGILHRHARVGHEDAGVRARRQQSDLREAGERQLPRRVRRDDERGGRRVSGVLREQHAESAAVHLRLQSRHVCAERQHQRRGWPVGSGHSYVLVIHPTADRTERARRARDGDEARAGTSPNNSWRRGSAPLRSATPYARSGVA